MPIELLVASLPDREKVVVELWVGNVQLAEVNGEEPRLRVEFYESANAEAISVDLYELMDALRRAEANLLGPQR